MIFTVTPDQIRSLDPGLLVKLLARLLHAEALEAGVVLRGISVPLQITVADGGEDGRIRWEGGKDKTDYLPCRFTIFQSKASNLGVAAWKKEVWAKSAKKKKSKKTKRTAKASTKPTLNAALTTLIAEGGAYIGFTSAPLVTAKCEELVTAIKQGIRATGANPAKLAAIHIYDANKIAEWSRRHPSVAIWLNEIQSGRSLAGFQTVDGWAEASDVLKIQHVTDAAARFSVGHLRDPGGIAPVDPNNALNSRQVGERILDHLVKDGNTVRLVGPSGLGKTRFIFEFIRDRSAESVVKSVNSYSAIICDYRNVDRQLIELAQALVRAQTAALLVVDECPKSVADQLSSIVGSPESKLRLISIDLDDQPIRDKRCLNLHISRSDDALVEGIIRQRLPKADASEISYIKNLCGGFPRIAVLATESYENQIPVLNSIEDVVDRILRGARISGSDDVRSIECLALFDSLGVDEGVGDQLDFVAAAFGATDAESMFEALARAAQHQLVNRRGRFFNVQPLPIAAFLGRRRLDLLRVSKVLDFIAKAPRPVLDSLFQQWRLFDLSRTAIAVSERLLMRDGPLGTREHLITSHGSKYFNALVHVAPDVAGDTLNREFGKLSIDELTKLGDGSRNLVWALERLVFRRATFANAAILLMRLAAAENESNEENAAGAFQRIFRLYLSGTEVPPADRFAILEEGLASTDERIIRACLEATGQTLVRWHFSRSGGAEEIGTSPPLKDWSPTKPEDVFDFYRTGLRLVTEIRTQWPLLADRCEQLIVSHLRELICQELFEDIKKCVSVIASEKGQWLEAMESVGDWLYFDRKGAPAPFSAEVRKLYDDLLPKDLVQLALLYTKFWPADIRDPDEVYDAVKSDFDYSTREARKIASRIAKDPVLVQQAIATMSNEPLKNAFPFAQTLATEIPNPVEAFNLALSIYASSDEKEGSQFIRGLLEGIDRRDPKMGDQCIRYALASGAFSSRLANIFTAVKMTPGRLEEVIVLLRDGQVTPAECVVLSYGRGLDDLDHTAIVPFVTALASSSPTEGIWAGLEVIQMYQHGRKTLHPAIEQILKAQLCSAALFDREGRGRRDGYVIESLIEILSKRGRIDESFIRSFCEQVARLCQVKTYRIFLDLDRVFQKSLKILVSTNALIVWQELSRFYEIATAAERDRLRNLVRADRHSFDDAAKFSPGLLFKVPEGEIVKWVKGDPDNRIGFAFEIVPMLTKEDGVRWHPAFERLAKEFGSIGAFTDTLRSRLHPNSWSGSLVPYLHLYLTPLESWFNHSVRKVKLWARETHQQLIRQIAYEKAREAEDL